MSTDLLQPEFPGFDTPGCRKTPTEPTPAASGTSPTPASASEPIENVPSGGPITNPPDHSRKTEFGGFDAPGCIKSAPGPTPALRTVAAQIAEVGAMIKELDRVQSNGDGRVAAEACMSALGAWAEQIHGQRRTKLHGAVALAFVLENPETARHLVPEWVPLAEPGPAFEQAVAAKMGLGSSPGRLSEFRRVGDFLLHLRRKSSSDVPLTARFGTYRDLLSVCRGQLPVAETLYRAHCCESELDEVGLERAIALFRDDHDQDRELQETEVRALRAALAVADQLVKTAAQSKADETLLVWDRLRDTLAQIDLEDPASVNSPKTGLEIRRQDDRLELHFTAALPPKAGEAVTALSLERGWTKPAAAGEAALEFNLSASASLARRQIRRGVAWYHSIIVGLGLPSAA